VAEAAPERGVVVGDALERGADRTRDVDARTLGVRAGLAIAPAEPDGARELAGEEGELVAGAGGALGIVEGLRLLDLLLKLGDAGSSGHRNFSFSTDPAISAPSGGRSLTAPLA